MATCGFGGAADGEEALLAALNTGEDVGERFGADVADRGDIGVGGGQKRLLKSGRLCLGVYLVDDYLDFVFAGFALEESKDFLAFSEERSIWNVSFSS